jgi:hypothetical protein
LDLEFLLFIESGLVSLLYFGRRLYESDWSGEGSIQELPVEVVLINKGIIDFSISVDPVGFVEFRDGGESRRGKQSNL